MTGILEITENLRSRGIRFTDKLTEYELRRIESVYDIIFPPSLRRFYSCGIPYAEKVDLFPRWTDLSEENIAAIKKRMGQPYEWLLISVKSGFWLRQWGDRPDGQSEAEKRFRETISAAPVLIPIYSHRYMPVLDDTDDPPVISTVGRDTIIYGRDLSDYLYHEFIAGVGYHSDKEAAPIPFWSDVIGYGD